MMNQVFLFLTNNPSLAIVTSFYKLRTEVTDLGDAFLLFHNNTDTIPSILSNLNCKYLFTDKILENLDYIPIFDSLLPGSNHFPLLDFYLRNPSYDYYWFIEDDVKFNGDWYSFFHFFNSFYEFHFLSSHIKTFNEEPKWHWWHTLKHPNKYIPDYARIRYFNPIYRISREALKFIHSLLNEKWQAHHEVLFATFLYREGYKIMDFGGTGNFVLNGHENKFYESNIPNEFGDLATGSMRYRPVLDLTEINRNLLYHPVKL